jgi:sugar/nucleoside kinase (ribokinase family)
VKLVTGGGLRVDYLVTHDGRVHTGVVGGNGLYAAVGAALWVEPVFLWARLGENYPLEWLSDLGQYGLQTEGLVPVVGRQDHRTFFAYTPDGRREDTNPAAHFARAGYPLPAELSDYVHSTPAQDDPNKYEPLALRPADWSAALVGATAVHLSPLSIRTHSQLPAFLRQQGVQQVTVDPGERYMIPALRPIIQGFLPAVDGFLPSRQEVETLFGREVTAEQAAVTLAEWGAPLVVIKNGAKGVTVYERQRGRLIHLPAYHRPGDGRVVDPTGAGDAFCGAFAAGLAQGGDGVTAARMGLVSASLVVEGYGALYALERKGEVRKRLEQISD